MNTEPGRGSTDDEEPQLSATSAKTCSTCRSLGARNCGYGSLGSKKYVSCDGATAIRNCDDCRRRFGTCQDRYITECFIG
ncbi:gambicin [Culex quinquefasciatus]|uniref:Gambicin n=1 Tax=Culex quinquefasciatus TaxID=7176 RepID=B0X977_CULQU|nr:gambicin [Culex quinquefasciatus]|eukprot:XP_001866199.1 gambicin [Culex quinquefasciatus]